MRSALLLPLVLGIAQATPVRTILTSGGRPITVEVFTPNKEASGSPAVLLLYGAGGLSRHGQVYRATAAELARNGFSVFLVHYFERTSTSWAGGAAIANNFLVWMDTVSDAIGFAAAWPGVDSKRIGLLGTSLGASLALAVSSQDSRVGGVVGLSGLLPDFALASLMRFPPALILHGANDPIVPASEAHKLERILQARKVGHEVRIYEGEGHVFGAAAARDSLERTVSFLKKVLAV